jgi:nicotinamide-nucleotide amidase
VKEIFSPELIALASRVIAENRAAQRTISVAESCTGGLVCTALTHIAGSSDVFEEGYITYSNEAKIRSLKVNPDIIDTFGAVSTATAWAMACGALECSDADVAVSITGIAGPSGGSDKKPVGTVVFGLAVKGQSRDDGITRKMLFVPEIGRKMYQDERTSIRQQAAIYALELLLP